MSASRDAYAHLLATLAEVGERFAGEEWAIADPADEGEALLVVLQHLATAMATQLPDDPPPPPAAFAPNGTRMRVTSPGMAETVSFQPRSFADGGLAAPMRYGVTDSGLNEDWLPLIESS